MNRFASDQLQPSGYLMQSARAGQVTKRTFTSSDGKKTTMSPAVVSDLSSIYADAVVASSEPLGWQNLRALEMRQTTSEWTMPPLENHCIIVQLGSAAEVTVHIGELSFKQSLRAGEITIVPADTSLHWQQVASAANHMLHLYLHPTFLRKIAESMEVDHT